MASKKLLIVDDDEDDIFMIRSILNEITSEFQLEEVHNGKAALAYLEKARSENNLPSLIILDINMPVMDGKQTLCMIKEQENFKAIPLVIFTTSNSILDKTFCNRHNVEMLTKPPTVDQLKQAVIRLLGMVQQ